MLDETSCEFQDATILYFQRVNALHQRSFEKSTMESWMHVHGIASLESSNLRIRMTTRALPCRLALRMCQKEEEGIGERSRERSSKCEEAKSGEDGERCCVLKGDIPWMIFYSWPSSPSATSTSSRSSQSRWCRSCRTAVSSASKRGSRPGLMDFTTPWGPLNPHSPSPLTSLSFQPPRAFPHTFSRFHVSAHVRRSKCGVPFFASALDRLPNFRRFYYALLDRSLRCIGLWRTPTSKKTSERWIRFRSKRFFQDIKCLLQDIIDKYCVQM